MGRHPWSAAGKLSTASDALTGGPGGIWASGHRPATPAPGQLHETETATIRNWNPQTRNRAGHPPETGPAPGASNTAGRRTPGRRDRKSNTSVYDFAVPGFRTRSAGACRHRRLPGPASLHSQRSGGELLIPQRSAPKRPGNLLRHTGLRASCCRSGVCARLDSSGHWTYLIHS